MNILNKIAVFLIYFYRITFKIIFPQSCRFHPSCSEYAKQCFETKPFLPALGKTLWRILRCGPWSRGGYDPVA